EVPHKFLTRGRIIESIPDFERFIRPFCATCDEVMFPEFEDTRYYNCPHDLTFMYDFLLLFEDKHGDTLPVVVSGNEAVRFLKGLRPTSVMLYENSKQTFQNLIRKLLAGVIDHGQPTEFFDFCVESYYYPR
ncbi:12093_t:CDS:2, partial [Racocetra persica]